LLSVCVATLQTYHYTTIPLSNYILYNLQQSSSS